MKAILIKSLAAVSALMLFSACSLGKAADQDVAKEKSPQAAGDYPIKPVPFTAVHLSDVFWAPRIEINRTVTIPFAFEQCEKSGRMDNFERAAAALRASGISSGLPARV